MVSINDMVDINILTLKIYSGIFFKYKNRNIITYLRCVKFLAVGGGSVKEGGNKKK